MLDDGDGSARSNIFRHYHEKQNGNTSSIKYEIIGYDELNIINYNSGFIGSWEYIVKNSKKIINFIDFPGNSKYIKTTLFGLMAHRPDYILIFIGLSNIINKKNLSLIIDDDTKLHFDLCVKLNLPFSIILTKNDDDSHKLIIPKIIDEIEKIIGNTKIKLCDSITSITNLDKDNIPFIPISNITGKNFDIIKHFLKNKVNINNDVLIYNKHICEFMINDVFYVNDVGIVVSGIVNNGRIKVDDKLLIGPINKTFYNVTIVSIHKKQIPTKYLKKNEIGSLVIKTDSKIEITKNLTIFSPDQLLNFVNKFKISIFKKNHFDIKKDNTLMIFCKNIYDCIIVNTIEEKQEEYILNVEFIDSNIQFLTNNEFVVMRCNNSITIGKIIV